MVNNMLENYFYLIPVWYKYFKSLFLGPWQWRHWNITQCQNSYPILLFHCPLDFGHVHLFLHVSIVSIYIKYIFIEQNHNFNRFKKGFNYVKWIIKYKRNYLRTHLNDRLWFLESPISLSIFQNLRVDSCQISQDISISLPAFTRKI